MWRSCGLFEILIDIEIKTYSIQAGIISSRGRLKRHRNIGEEKKKRIEKKRDIVDKRILEACRKVGGKFHGTLDPSASKIHEFSIGRR